MRSAVISAPATIVHIRDHRVRTVARITTARSPRPAAIIQSVCDSDTISTVPAFFVMLQMRMNVRAYNGVKPAIATATATAVVAATKPRAPSRTTLSPASMRSNICDANTAAARPCECAADAEGHRQQTDVNAEQERRAHSGIEAAAPVPHHVLDRDVA